MNTSTFKSITGFPQNPEFMDIPNFTPKNHG